ncbi:MAG: L-dopachrome tautomerase-related protein [Devosia sp.]
MNKTALVTRPAIGGTINSWDGVDRKLEVVAEWTRLPFHVTDPVIRRAWETSSIYPTALMQGIKLDSKGRIFISSARWAGPEVPATLSSIETVDGKPVLVPYPSPGANAVSDPRGLKSVLGFEIDRNDVIWILDQGHIGGTMSPGDAKIVLWDIRSNREVQRLVLPSDIADPKASFLNDIVVDNDSGFGYITDSGIFARPLRGGLIIYDATKNVARRILDGSRFTNNEPDFVFNIGGYPVLKREPMLTGADGIALSGDKQTLYWTNLTGNTLYSVPTSLLRDFSVPESEIDSKVRIVKTLPSNTDGLTSDREGNIYMTALSLNGLMRLDATSETLERFVHHPEMRWPDTLAWGPDGALYLASNNLNVWADGEMNFVDPEIPNFRIWRVSNVGLSYTTA